MNYRQMKKLSKKSSELLPNFDWKLDKDSGTMVHREYSELLGECSIEASSWLAREAYYHYNRPTVCRESGDYLLPDKVVELTPKLIFKYGRNLANL